MGTESRGYRQSYPFGSPVVEVIVEQAFKRCEDVAVLVVVSDELTVVEARAVVEERLDAVRDEVLAVAVYRVAQLILNFAEAVYDDLPFLRAEVQSLVHFVGEERVFAHRPSERRVAQQVRMEHQQVAVGLEFRAVAHTAVPRTFGLSGTQHRIRKLSVHGATASRWRSQ